MRGFLRRYVLNNAGIKLASLALAIVLYLHVFARQEREVVVDVPLELRNVPAGLVWSGELPSTARVRLRGPGIDLFKLRTGAERIRVSVDVAEARAGLYQRPIVPQDVRLPRGGNIEVIAIERPSVISLSFDRVLAHKLPVVARINGRPAPGYVQYGEPVVEPDSALVSGPESRLGSFAQVRTETVDISAADETVVRRVPLVPPPDSEISPAGVTVRVDIERVISRTFTNLPVEVLHDHGVTRKRLAPETGSVVVSGPESLVESLSRDDLRLTIDARDYPAGAYTLMASVELRRSLASGSVSVEPVEPERFEVELE